jgi:hypothetical protein
MVVYLFRFSWLIFGTVELTKSNVCNLFLVRMAFMCKSAFGFFLFV